MAEVTVRTTIVPGLLEVGTPVHHDDRGWFKESFQRAKLTAAGFPEFEICQSNIAHNGPVGITRGIHAEPWDKYVHLARGRAFAAILDLRAGVTFGRVATVELHEGNALFIPRGCGNSYQTLEEGTVYAYLTNGHWSPEAAYTLVDAFDPALGIDWPISPDRAVRSAKDAALPSLADVVAAGPR